MSKYSVKPISPQGLKTSSLVDRPSLVDVSGFARPMKQDGIQALLDSLPDILAGRAFRELVKDLRVAREGGFMRLFGLGAHVIKVGLCPVLIDLMDLGWISGIALNGAGIIHDFEIAFSGKTSEDVPARLDKGCFGNAEETGAHLNEAIRSGAEESLGLGEAVGRMIARSSFPFKGSSLLGAA